VLSSVANGLPRTKLSLSHALSQSVKISLVSSLPLPPSRYIFVSSKANTNSSKFEELISTTVEATKHYPEIISETGKIGLPHKGWVSALLLAKPSLKKFLLCFFFLNKEIMRKMGEVFLLRTNIAAVGSVLDSPDVFWVSVSVQAETYHCPLTIYSLLPSRTLICDRFTRQHEVISRSLNASTYSILASRYYRTCCAS
jgi:hypothetical protein